MNVSTTTLGGVVLGRLLTALPLVPEIRFVGCISGQTNVGVRKVLGNSGIEPKYVIGRGGRIARLMKNTDALYVSNFPRERSTVICQLLRLPGEGKIILVEKPLAIDQGGLLQYRQLEQAGYTVLCAHNLGFHPAIVLMRAVVDAAKQTGYSLGGLGAVYGHSGPKSSHRDLRRSGGPKFDLGTHAVNFLQEVVGRPLTGAKLLHEGHEEHAFSACCGAVECVVSCTWARKEGFSGHFWLRLDNGNQSLNLSCKLEDNCVTIHSRPTVELARVLQLLQEQGLQFSRTQQRADGLDTWELAVPQENFTANMLRAALNHQRGVADYPFPLAYGEQLTELLLNC